MGRAKITIVGAGNVGATCAHWCAAAELGDIVLLDIPAAGDMPKGKALDLMQSSPIVGFDSNIVGTTDYADSANSDVVVITAGIPRKPGMSRDDLLATNAKIVGSVAESVKNTSPNAIVIVVSNPLDAMVQRALQVTGFSPNRVFGQAGVLDTARYRTFLAMELGVSVEDVSALLMGGHGDTMVPLPRYCSVAGIPITRLLSAEKIAAIAARTQNAGGEVVNLLKTGSAFVSPAHSAIEMAEAILLDEKRVLACACFLEGEYGVSGLYVGVPCVLGAGGVEKVLEIEMDAAERKLFDASIEHVRSLTAQIEL